MTDIELMQAPAPICDFRAPHELARSPHGATRALLIGSCTVEHFQWALKARYGVSSHFVHINALATTNWRRLDEPFDFLAISIPMDLMFQMHRDFHDDMSSPEQAAQRFQRAYDLVQDLLPRALEPAIEKGIPAFVCNFLVPQQNPRGRLLPRYDLRNPAFFVEELNRRVAEVAARYRNVHLLDVDAVCASLGKARIQDDSIWPMSHGGLFTHHDHDLYQRFAEAGHVRPEPFPPLNQWIDDESDFFWWAATAELMACYRTIRQIDQVKVVVVDLDDTLWRGIAADPVMDGPVAMIEGLPLGLVEALLHLEARGAALAIVSKNDEETIRALWPRTIGRFLSLDKFVSVKINWQSKPDNISVIASELNVGLDSIVFIDDHPREREEVAARLPRVRVLGGDPYSVRRILLWAPETQVAAITEESAHKTSMLRERIAREETRQTMSREDFLRSLDLRIFPDVFTSLDHRGYPRAIELVNKTNQFNTTGERWTDADVRDIFNQGGYLVTIRAADRTSDYGVIAVAIVCRGDIRIIVMSCRVIGLDIELAMLRVIEELERDRGTHVVRSTMIDTERNTLSRDLFRRGGYGQDGNIWTKDISGTIAIPPHITVHDEALT